MACGVFVDCVDRFFSGLFDVFVDCVGRIFLCGSSFSCRLFSFARPAFFFGAVVFGDGELGV